MLFCIVVVVGCGTSVTAFISIPISIDSSPCGSAVVKDARNRVKVAANATRGVTGRIAMKMCYTARNDNVYVVCAKEMQVVAGI